jgi:hypothetical protein
VAGEAASARAAGMEALHLAGLKAELRAGRQAGGAGLRLGAVGYGDEQGAEQHHP